MPSPHRAMNRRTFMAALATAPAALAVGRDCKHVRHCGCADGQFITVYCADCGEPLYDPRAWPESTLAVAHPWDKFPDDYVAPRIPRP